MSWLWRFLNTDVSKNYNAFIPEDMNDKQHNCEDIKYEMSPIATEFKPDRNDKCCYWMDINVDVTFYYSKWRHIKNNLDIWIRNLKIRIYPKI
jgi:hypothetical protein